MDERVLTIRCQVLTRVCSVRYDCTTISCFAFWTEQTCFCNGHCNTIWVTVSWWSAILEVAFHFLGYLARDTDAGAPVGHTSWEIFNAGGFMATCESPFVVISLMWVICTDMFAVFCTQLLDGLFDVPVVKWKGISLKIAKCFKRSHNANIHGCKISLLTNTWLLLYKNRSYF